MLHVLYPHRAVAWSIVFCICFTVYALGKVELYFIQQDLNIALAHLDNIQKAHDRFMEHKSNVLRNQ